MSDAVTEKIKKLGFLYPPERIKKLRQRINLFWDGVTDKKILFTLRRRDVPAGLNHNEYELGVFSPEDALSTQLDDRIFKASLPDDYIPSVITGNSPFYLSIAAGAEWKRVGRGSLVSFPLVQNSSEIIKLKLPKFDRLPDSPFTQCIERIEYFLEKSKGLLPLTLPDPQGPMSLAAQLWNQENLFISMITDPRSVHRIMRFCMETTVIFYQYLFRRFGREQFVTVHCHPYLFRKEGEGISLSEDMIGVLSPGQLKEFLVPYLNEIADEFGPLVIHSCGDCRRKFSVMRKVAKLAGVNFAQTDISSVSREDLSSLCLLSPGDWENREQIGSYIKTLKEKKIRGWVQVHTLGKEIDQEAEKVSLRQWTELVNCLSRLCN